MTSQGIQVGEFPNRPYQLYETRKKSEIRTKVIEKFRDLLNLYVQGDESALHDLLDDLLPSKQWSSTFRILPNSKGDFTVRDKVLHSIVKEYKDCKNKQVNSEIPKQAKRMTQAINISGTLSKSKTAFTGSTPDSFRSRTGAARNLGRISYNSAERRRLLSVVASDYLQPFLTKLFQCSKSTLTAARVHAILFGRGGVPPASIQFSRQYISQEVLDQLGDFLLRDDVSRPSSCRSMLTKARSAQLHTGRIPSNNWLDSITWNFLMV